MDRKKVMLSLSTEAIAVIAKNAPSHKKKGEWVTQLVMDYAQSEERQTDVLERIEQRLDKLEQLFSSQPQTL